MKGKIIASRLNHLDGPCCVGLVTPIDDENKAFVRAGLFGDAAEGDGQVVRTIARAEDDRFGRFEGPLMHGHHRSSVE